MEDIVGAIDLLYNLIRGLDRKIEMLESEVTDSDDIDHITIARLTRQRT